jgi:flavin-dependent dehydrogenase
MCHGHVSTNTLIIREGIDVQVADAIIVGGGPAGSTCAWKLRAAGLDVLVLDRMKFPRTKLCAGWVTPEALADLELDPNDYPMSFMTFDNLHLHWGGLSLKLPSRQHSIRRFEFDEYLLRRAGARVLQHRVRAITRDGDGFVIDGLYRCKYLVGAGGTSCPVYKTLFHERNTRSSELQTATYEHEFAYDWRDKTCHLWFFGDGLPGYAWYVPKANGYINVGLGGMAGKMKRRGGNVQRYWHSFVAKLAEQHLVNYDRYHPTGYSYYLHGNVDIVTIDNAYIVGDAAGLATRDMGEGIGPAVKSGLLAAESIATGTDYSLSGIHKLSAGGIVKEFFNRKPVDAPLLSS